MPRKKSATNQTTGRTTRRKRVSKSTNSAKATADAKPDSVESVAGAQDGTLETESEKLQSTGTPKRRSRRKKKNDVGLDAIAERTVSDDSANLKMANPEIEGGGSEADSPPLADIPIQNDLDVTEANPVEEMASMNGEAAEAEGHGSGEPFDNEARQHNLSVPPFEGEDEDPSLAVEVVVDQRSPDDENPQPIHPMEAMTAQLSEPMPESLVSSDLASSDAETVTVEAIDAAVVIEAKDAVVVEAVAVNVEDDAVEDDSTSLKTTVEALNGAIATAHRHEEELEAQLVASREHEHELTQKVQDVAKESKRLAQLVASAELKEMALKQEIADLKEELTQAKTQVMQAQSQLNDQDKNQREIDKLKGEVVTCKEDLDEAKRYILQLTDQLSKAQISAPSPSTTQPPVNASTSFPPPLTQRPPHTRVVGSPRRQPRRPEPRPVVPMAAASGQKPAGLPPMSTERLSGSAPTTPPARPARSLRTAYTRPGFSKPQPISEAAEPSTSSSQPIPPLESITRSSTPSTPHTEAIVPQKSSSIARRRSRYDTLKPEIKSSDLPQPKVSDSEIGWFD